MNTKINYAILGCGHIAKRVAEGIKNEENSILYSFASRRIEKAKEYKDSYGAMTFGSYKDMLNDENINVVYICTPNDFHYDQILMCLNHGKNVICEKPMVKTIKELEELYEIASRKKLVLMEAHKTVFTPLNKLIKQRIKANEFGKLLSIEADYSINFFDYPEDMNNHWVTSADFGGCSYDIGVYPLVFSNYIADSKIKFFNTKTLRHKDFICDFGFESEIEYENGVTSKANSSWLKLSPNKGSALIKLEKCEIEIPAYWKGKNAIIHYADHDEKIEVEMVSDFTGEVKEVTDLLRNNKTESEVMNLEASKEILKIIESVNIYRN